MGYELVIFYESANKSRRIYLRTDGPTVGRWLRGYEVDKTGEEIQPRGADRRLRIIDKAAIISRRPCRMDPTYAELVPGKPMLDPSKG